MMPKMPYYIQFSDEQTFEDALLKCAQPMLDENIIDKSYIEEILNVMNTDGCYFVLLDGIAFAHANPEKGSNELGLSVLILDNEVNCKEYDVKVILLLSGKDHEHHLKLLKYLATNLKDNNDKLLKEAKNIQEVEAVLFNC